MGDAVSMMDAQHQRARWPPSDPVQPGCSTDNEGIHSELYHGVLPWIDIAFQTCTCKSSLAATRGEAGPPSGSTLRSIALRGSALVLLTKTPQAAVHSTACTEEIQRERDP
jgi:hypothetical protein